MPPKTQQESVIFVIHVGVTEKGAKKDLSFLEKSKTVVKRLIERKIFFRPKDEISVLAVGLFDTKDEPHKPYVKVIVNTQFPSWDIVETVSDLKGTNHYCTWENAMRGINIFILDNVDESDKKTKTKPMRKLILISDFKEDVEDSLKRGLSSIVDTLIEGGIQVLAIGEEDINEKSEDTLRSSHLALKKILPEIPGEYLTINEAIAELKYYKNTSKKAAPWYCDLTLGSVKIPIVAYVKITDASQFPSWKRAKDNQKVGSVTRYLDRQHNEYNPEEMTKGFKYGNEFHAVPEEQAQSMHYDGGPKSYGIYAFARIDRVGLEFWCKASTRIVFPSPKQWGSAKLFYSLAQAMMKKKLVAIVRKVYGKGTTPRMVALFPCIEVSGEPWCLIEVALPFAEDRRVLNTRPMNSIVKQLTNEQNEAVDQLLDALILDDSASEVEDVPSFGPGTVPNPALQHKWHMLSYRATNPDGPLPPMADYLRHAFEIPSIQEKCKEPLTRIQSLFNLEKVIPEKKRKINEDEQAVVTKAIDEPITKVEKTAESDDEVPSNLMVNLSDVNMDDLEADI